MLNFEVIARLLFFVVAACNFSHVCWHVFSPGADISQNSVMSVTTLFLPKWREALKYKIKQKNKLILFLSKVFQSYRISDKHTYFKTNLTLTDDPKQSQIYFPGSKSTLSSKLIYDTMVN